MLNIEPYRDQLMRLSTVEQPEFVRQLFMGIHIPNEYLQQRQQQKLVEIERNIRALYATIIRAGSNKLHGSSVVDRLQQMEQQMQRLQNLQFVREEFLQEEFERALQQVQQLNTEFEQRLQQSFRVNGWRGIPWNEQVSTYLSQLETIPSGSQLNSDLESIRVQYGGWRNLLIQQNNILYIGLHTDELALLERVRTSGWRGIPWNPEVFERLDGFSSNEYFEQFLNTELEVLARRLGGWLTLFRNQNQILEYVPEEGYTWYIQMTNEQRHQQHRARATEFKPYTVKTKPTECRYCLTEADEFVPCLSCKKPDVCVDCFPNIEGRKCPLCRSPTLGDSPSPRASRSSSRS